MIFKSIKYDTKLTSDNKLNAHLSSVNTRYSVNLVHEICFILNLKQVLVV